MKLRTYLAASAFALAAVVYAGAAQAKVAGAANEGGYAQSGERETPGDYGQRPGRRGGGWGQHQQPAAPPPPPSQNYQPQQRAHQPQYPGAGAPPPPPPPGYAGGQHYPRDGYRPRHPRQGGYVPPPPPPGTDPRYAGGHGGHHPRHWDRRRGRDRFRDGAAVILGLGVLGALAQPRYDDPYDGYDSYPPNDVPGYEPGDGYYEGDQGYGYGEQQQGGSLIRCSSNDYQQTYCPIPQGARATLRRRLSSASCDYGRDWGLAPNAVWVANGCRAVFSVY